MPPIPLTMLRNIPVVTPVRRYVNPHPPGSDAPYQGLPFETDLASGRAMPSGLLPRFSSSAGEKLYLFAFTINKLQIQTTCKIAELIEVGSMKTCLLHHTILF